MAGYVVPLLSDALPTKLRRSLQLAAFSSMFLTTLAAAAIPMSGNATGMKDKIVPVGKMKWSACGTFVSCAVNVMVYSLKFAFNAGNNPEFLVLVRSRMRAVKAPTEVGTPAQGAARKAYEARRTELVAIVSGVQAQVENPAVVVPV